VLAKLHPSLKGDGWLARKYEQARQLSNPDSPPMGLYLALLVYLLAGEETERLISYLRLPKLLAQTLRDTIGLKDRLEELASPKLSPSRIYHLLHGCSSQAITASSLASDSPMARQRLHFFLDKLRYVKPILTGNDLQNMGIAPGPRIKEILNFLLDARLDGKVTSKQNEEELVKRWLARDN
jgi:tRNA nucleotidyltransferase (CCA-adding enzyme)